MPYVKIEDGIFRNPKMVSVGTHAKVMYVASICYCGSSLTDGFIPSNAVRMLAADTAIASANRPVNELVGAGLWREVEGGYEVHDYLVYNESSDKVQAKKKAARDRMNTLRSQNNEESSPDVRANKPRTSREVREPTTTIDVTTVSNETETETTATPTSLADKPPNAQGGKASRTKLPENGPAQQLVKAFCEATGLDRPAAYDKAVGQAQKLVKAGCTPSDMPDIIGWLRAQPRFRDEIDMGIVLNEFDKWRVSQCQTPDDTYIAAFGDDNVRRMAEWLDALNGTFGGVGWVRTSLRKLAVEVPGLTPEQLKTGLTTGFGRAETSLKAEDARIANPPALVHAMFRDALREQREVAA